MKYFAFEQYQIRGCHPHKGFTVLYSSLEDAQNAAAEENFPQSKINIYEYEISAIPKSRGDGTWQVPDAFLYLHPAIKTHIYFTPPDRLLKNNKKPVVASLIESKKEQKEELKREPKKEPAIIVPGFRRQQLKKAASAPVSPAVSVQQEEAPKLRSLING